MAPAALPAQPNCRPTARATPRTAPTAYPDGRGRGSANQESESARRGRGLAGKARPRRPGWLGALWRREAEATCCRCSALSSWAPRGTKRAETHRGGHAPMAQPGDVEGTPPLRGGRAKTRRGRASTFSTVEGNSPQSPRRGAGRAAGGPGGEWPALRGGVGPGTRVSLLTSGTRTFPTPRSERGAIACVISIYSHPASVGERAQCRSA